MTRLVFDFTTKPHAERMLAAAFRMHGAGTVEVPETLYHTRRGLKIYGISRRRRYTWIPCFVDGQDEDYIERTKVRAVITHECGEWKAVVVPLEPEPEIENVDDIMGEFLRRRA